MRLPFNDDNHAFPFFALFRWTDFMLGMMEERESHIHLELASAKKTGRAVGVARLRPQHGVSSLLSHG